MRGRIATLTAVVFVLALVPANAQTPKQVVIIGGGTLDMTVPCGSDVSAANVMGWSGGGCLPLNIPPQAGIGRGNGVG